MRSTRLVAAAALAATLSACALATSDQHSPSERGETTAKAASALTPSQGLLPYPIKYSGNSPLLGPDQKPVVAWSGSLPDLMAADAWATCAQHTNDVNGETDGYIWYLVGKMIEDLSCSNAQHLPAAGDVGPIWRARRQSAACNADTSTGAQKSIGFAPYSPYQIGNPIPGAVNGYTDALADAQVQLNIADENLCMAQKLREDMVTADGLLLSAADQRELLEIIRERAQISVLQYSSLTVAFTSPDTRKLGAYQPHQILTILRAFADRPENAGELAQMGRDFASAILLHSQVTDELAQLLTRHASAHTPHGTAAPSRPADDWAIGSWRERLSRLLYGGDPLAAAYGNKDNLWQHFSGTSTENYLFQDRTKFVSEDLQGPESLALLDLARGADALYLRTTVKVDDTANDEFLGLDVEATADRVYRAVDASLVHPECVAAKTCEALAGGTDVHGVADYASSALWARRRISGDHARALVRALDQAIPQLNGRYHDTKSVELLGEHEGSMHFTGHHEVLQEADVKTRLPGAPSGVWYHLAPDFTAVPKSTVERGSPMLNGFHLPTTIDAYSVGPSQGFGAHWRDQPGTASDAHVEGSARMRMLGSVSALSAARDALFTGARGLTLAPSNSAPAFLAAAKAALPVIDSAIGSRSIAVRPVTVARWTYGSCPGWAGFGSQWCWESTQSSPDGNTLDWEVDVLTTADDPFTELWIASDSDLVPLPIAASLDPAFRSFSGETRASLLAASKKGTLVETQPGDGNRVRRVFHVQTLGEDFASLIARNPKAAGTANELLPLADRMHFDSRYSSQPVDGDQAHPKPVWHSRDGKFLSLGGSLNRLAEHAWATLAYNWSRPAFDGFGLPVDWFPPTDPSLYGSQQGDTAVAFYLRSAKDAANEATTTVQAAVSELLREQSDNDVADAARKRAEQLSALERASLCGQSVTCDTSTQGVDITTAVVDPATCDLSFCQDFDTMLRQAVPAHVNLASPVVAHLPKAGHAGSESPPSFDDYAGGALQKDFITEWGALKHVLDAADDAYNLLVAKDAAYRSAEAVLAAAKDRHADACSDQAFRDAVAAGMTASFDKHGSVWVRGYFNDNGGWWEPTSAVEGTFQGSSWNSGPLVQAENACLEAARGINTSVAEAAATKADAWAAVGAQISLVADAGTNLQIAIASLNKTISDSNVAVARAQVEAGLSTAGQLTRFGTYQRFHSDDVLRARNKMDTARKYAAVARRAIESQFVVDFASMHQPEPFAPAPADWADTIYEADLDVRDAAGISIPVPTASNPSPTPSPVNTNQIADYVSYLEGFVRGYAVSRPTSVVHSDSEIIALPAPDTRETQTIGGTSATVLSLGSSAWTFSCDGGATWIAHPALGQVPATATLATACSGKPPTHARYVFSLDPWGRLNGDTANPPFVLRHNARWTRFTVNLEGTGVHSCGLAANPTDCANNPYARFSLTHTGPAWTTNYDQQWRVLGVSAASVEDGKALANEESLSIPGTAWGKPEVDLLARSELFERPLGGTYQLDLEVPPELILSKIDAIQVLYDTSYWVKQQ